MRAVIQRAGRTVLSVEGQVVSEIPRGLVVFLGIGKGDTAREAAYTAKKIAQLRVFEDETGKMNLSAAQVGGEVLLVSQFTLYGDLTRGNRPSFSAAEEPTAANELYLYTAEQIRAYGLTVRTGVFGADMKIEQLNDGPVTVLLDTADKGGRI